MNVLRPFDPEFWIEYDHEPPSNVLYLNTPFARANAAQVAQLDEDERKAIRRDEIVAELEELYNERERINVRIFDLENEQASLRAPQQVKP